MTDKEYYNDREWVTNSMLGWALAGPKYMYKRMNRIGEEEEEPAYFKFGRAAHMKLFEPKAFSQTYFIPKYSGPSNAVQVKFCDLLISTKKIDDDVLVTAYKISYSVDKKSNDAILKAAQKLYEDNKYYIEETKKNIDKELLSKSDYNRISTFENMIKSHKRASDLIYGYAGCNHGSDIYTEFIIKFKSGEGRKFKSKIDKFVIDHETKKVVIVEFKTHSTRNEDARMDESFKKSFDAFDYDRQFYVYYLAICSFLQHECKVDEREYKFEFKTVAVKSNFDHEVRVFSINDKYIDEGSKKFEQALKVFTYYQENGYEYPYGINKLYEEELKP